VQLVAATGSPPHVGHPDPAYETWGADAPVYRPLVLVSPEHVSDPEQWKPRTPDPALIGRAADAFLAEVKRENGELPLGPAEVRLSKSYRSRQGESLLALSIGGREPPSDEVPGEEWSLHWFLARTDGRLEFLGNDLLLIDAGDYDGDGRSEVLFLKSGYDEDGYVLFFDDFKEHAEFAWQYH